MHRVLGSECPRCGADVIAPQWSEHVSVHCIRNTWSCDICDHQFEEAVYLSAAELTGVNLRSRAKSFFDRDIRRCCGADS